MNLRALAPWLALLALAALPSLPGCPSTPSDDDDSAADDDDSTPLASCPGDEDGWEENDTFETATPVAVGGSWPGVACPGDPDWYGVSVPYCTTVELSVSGPGAASLGLWLHDEAGGVLSSVPTATAAGGAGYAVEGENWHPGDDDDDSAADDDDAPPPDRIRLLQIFAPDGAGGGLSYTLDVQDAVNKNCDE